MQIPSNNSQLSLNRAQSESQTQSDRIGGGKRINSARDDAAGLAISSRLDAQVASAVAARKNLFDGMSRLQVEDGALNSIGEEVQRIRELVVQQQNGILSDEDKGLIQLEIDERLESIATQTSDSQFNGQNVFQKGEINFQTGENPGQTIEIETLDLSQSFQDIGLVSGETLSLEQIDEGLSTINSRRSELGAVSNRLSSQADFLELKNNQNQETSSRIQDADLAEAISKKTAADIQQKVAISVQSQANLNKSLVLNLLNS